MTNAKPCDDTPNVGLILKCRDMNQCIENGNVLIIWVMRNLMDLLAIYCKIAFEKIQKNNSLLRAMSHFLALWKIIPFLDS
jgi:hypothetical protein